MFRCLAAALTVVCLIVPAVADERLADVEAINDVVGRLDEAFGQQDVETVKALMTKDHLAVMPYRAAPESVEEVIALLPKIKMKQIDLSEPTVTLLGPDSAIRTLTAKFEGSYAGKPMDDKVFVTSIMAKKDGKWLESFYQVTKLAQ